MTPAESRILDRAKQGIAPTPADIVQTISCLAELDGYRVGLSARGALTTDAMEAIKARQDQLVARGR